MSDRIYREIAKLLNATPTMADKMDIGQLRSLLEAAEEAYSNAIGEPILDDAVYDYAHDALERRTTSVFAPPVGKPSIRVKLPAPGVAPPYDAPTSAPAGKSLIVKLPPKPTPPVVPTLAHVPEPRGPTVKLPYWMGSMTKVVDGTEDVVKWAAKFPGPYVITAKMDGASATYTMTASGKSMLLSRGKGAYGQDISSLLKYLKLPVLKPGMAVRGELILQRSVFEAKHKRATAKTETDDDEELAEVGVEVGDDEELAAVDAGASAGKYRNSRNAVSGVVNSAGQKSKSINTELAADLHFIAYELMQPELAEPSKQLLTLETMGFEVVPHQMEDSLGRAGTSGDAVLSTILDEMMGELDFDIDGLVIYSDHRYLKNTSGNPDYARAYKKDIASLMKPTKVISVEWNVTRYSYLTPVVIVEPVRIDNVVIARITGNNAKYIVDNGIGAGAELIVIRSKGVIPKIVEVTKRVEPGLPELSYRWNPTHVNLLYDGPAQGEQQDEESISTKREVAVEKLYFFVKTIGAKGVGAETISKIYDAGFTKIGDLLTLRPDNVSFLGPKTSVAVVESIRHAVSSLTLPTMMAASGMFGRGMGVRRFEAIIAAYPDIVDSDEARENSVALKTMIQALPTFAAITAGVVAEGFPKFIKFFTEDIPTDIAVMIQENTVDTASAKEAAIPSSGGRGAELAGKNIVLTGFRDAEIQKFIELHGGKIQTAFSGTTNILIIKDASVSNKKTEAASAKGTKVITKDEFKREYLI